MIFTKPNWDFTKSSVFSLTSTTTAITVNRNMAKKKVVRNFLSMYQSIFFILCLTKIKAGNQAGTKRMLKALKEIDIHENGCL
jgi:hypothetical protein